jgi:hypothetical protein
MSTSDGEVVFLIFAIISYGVLPATLAWGWERWVKLPKARTVPSMLSFVGFFLATASAALAISFLVYAQVVHFSGGLDPVLYRTFGSGVWISLAGILFSLSGVWWQSSLRLHAPVCALGTLAFWMNHTEFFPIVN